MTLGIVIPCYRESLTIARLLGALHELHPDAEIVVVDDSPDTATGVVISDLANPRVTYIHRQEKGGRGSAVLEGFKALRSRPAIDVFIEMDADYSHDPGEIADIVRTLRETGADMIIGSRYVKGSAILDWPMGRHVFSAASNWLARRVLEVPVADYTNGFRCYNRAAMEIVLAECGHHGKGFISLSETLVNLYYRDLKVVEVPTRFVNRQRGESSLTRNEIQNAAVGLWKVAGVKRRLKARGSQP